MPQFAAGALQACRKFAKQSWLRRSSLQVHVGDLPSKIAVLSWATDRLALQQTHRDLSGNRALRRRDRD